MNKQLKIIYFCLFSIMTGFGLALPVLPFYVERLTLSGGSSTFDVSIHVGLITGVFALMQFFFAPIWGRLSDKLGPRPLIILGLGGYAVSMVFFGLGTNLAMLYTARILGGVFAAAVLPAANAYVVILTLEKDRGRGFARLESAISFGIVAGPALGSFLSYSSIHLVYPFWHFRVDGFSIPFFIASLLSLFAMATAVRWLPESRPAKCNEKVGLRESKKIQVMALTSPEMIPRVLILFLVLAFIAKMALALFEGIFTLHARQVLQYGPFEMGVVFIVCGLVMAVVQGSIVAWLISRIGEKPLLSAGYLLMGLGLVLLMTTRTMGLILFYVSIFALGVALITPSLATLVSRHAGDRPGTAFGLLSASNSLGQAGGPTFGGLLFAWKIHAPFTLTAVLLMITAIYITRFKLAGYARPKQFREAE